MAEQAPRSTQTPSPTEQPRTPTVYRREGPNAPLPAGYVRRDDGDIDAIYHVVDGAIARSQGRLFHELPEDVVFVDPWQPL